MSNPQPYGVQHRGDSADYANYFAGMDATMRQKLAFVGAHFLLDAGSRVADMGSGSGSGTYHLALLNPQIDVIGVDINPESIRYASEKFKLPNLSFVVGDVAEPLPADKPLDGVLSSSTLHHVYTFNGYSHAAVRQAIRSHLGSLRDGGVFVLRDFVCPDKSAFVLLELPDEASRGESVIDLSPADLLVRFARTARPLDTRTGPGFFLEEVEPARAGTRRFRLPHKWAAEFVWRKDYRRDWDVELLEEYSYFTAEEFAEELMAAGARLISAEPYWNPWIVKNRFERKFALTSEDGRPLPWPATNFVAVAQKVAPGSSLRLIERRPADRPPTFLIRTAMRKGQGPDARLYDLVKRPHPVCDILPWRWQDGRLRVVARHGYPRPITRAVPRGPAMLDGAQWGGYLIEPVTGMASAADVSASLIERAGLSQDDILAVEPSLTYYPSPGGIDEVVASSLVEIGRPVSQHSLPASMSGFSTSGRVQEFDAQSLLRAAHVGVLPEARLELNLYALMRHRGVTPDPFLGEAVQIAASRSAAHRRTSLAELLARPAEAPFQHSEQTGNFLRLVRSVFADQTEDEGVPRTLAEQELEFVVPREYSVNTAVVLPVFHDGEYFVGLETRLLPVPQLHEGNARILVAPAYRLGREVTTVPALQAAVAAKLGIAALNLTPLGAPYFPSAGITPERVHPFVADVTGAASPHDFVPLADLGRHTEQLRDGHLMIAAFRLMHALGPLGQ